uniref:NADH-ubiquinone oxidoreductase chain 6 n=1 Tax=Megaloblatta sp. ECMD1 TaxID=2093495 RepID=A0A2P1H9F4_9NEOP|nr:NADH dehydrogenase subunit 6 [Megaloblatta sp. ECMD1]
MTTFMMISSMLSIMFIYSNHPLIMGLILLMQTMMISMMSSMMSHTFWFSYILFLILVGGMLILFIYVTSIASNEMIYISTKTLPQMMMFTVLLTIFIYKNKSFLQNQESMTFTLMNNQLSMVNNKLYNYPTNIMTIILASYLFLTLITVIKITNIFKGPLRQMK